MTSPTQIILINHGLHQDFSLGGKFVNLAMQVAFYNNNTNNDNNNSNNDTKNNNDNDNNKTNNNNNNKQTK